MEGKKQRRKLPRSSCVLQNGRAMPHSQKEQEVEEEEHEEGGGGYGGIKEEEIQELPSSNQGEVNCLTSSTLGHEEKVEKLAKELDLSFSSDDSAFESDMDDLF